MSTASVFFFVFLTFAVTTLYLGKILTKADRDFKENAKRTRAYIVSYKIPEGSNFEYPYVRFFDEGKEVTALCTSGGIKASFYPPGTELEIYYYKKTVLGNNVYEVRRADDSLMGGEPEMGRVGKFMYVLCSIFSVGALISGICHFII